MGRQTLIHLLHSKLTVALRTLKYSAAVIAGDSDMVKLQIVDPDPIILPPYHAAVPQIRYTRMQQLLDNHYFTRVKVKNCDPQPIDRSLVWR